MKREVIFSVDCLGLDWSQERAQAVLDLLPDEWDHAIATPACASKFDPCERHLDRQSPPAPEECDQCESYSDAYVGPGWTLYRGDKYVSAIAPFEVMETAVGRERYLAKVRYAFERAEREAARA